MKRTRGRFSPASNRGGGPSCSPSRRRWAVCVLTCVGAGCGVQGPPVQQTAGRDATTDASTALVRVDKIEPRLGTVETEFGDLALRLGALETEQRQTGLINVAASGGGLAVYLALAVAVIAAWWFWRRAKHWKGTCCVIASVIEEEEADRLKHKIAKATSKDTLFGRLVAADIARK